MDLNLVLFMGRKLPVDRDNYTSAFRFRSAVEKQIKLEIELRNYIVCKRPLEARQRMVRIMTLYGPISTFQIYFPKIIITFD
jgi:hypothetical protein